MSAQTYRIHCLSTALSPLTHMAGVEGNEAVLQREPIVTPQGVRYLPCLSGNALRHRMIRQSGARFLVDRWGLRGRLSMRQLNFLFHGGNLTESTARQDTKNAIEFQRLFPLYRLIGGALPDAILPGSLICDRGILICRENANRISGMVPWDVPHNLRPAEAFVGGYQYTRGDAKNSARDLMPPEGAEPGETNLMIFSGQSVIAGSAFLHGFVVQWGSELEIGALLLSISLWQKGGATIGGQASRGHGRLETLLNIEPDIDAEALMRDYVAHVDAVKDEAMAWLDSAFAPPAKDEKPKRGKKAKHEAAENIG